MKLKTTKISDLTPHERNPNRHPEEQLNELESSLEQFEQVKNIVAWNNKVIAGCGLLEAAKRQGKDVIEVQDVSDWSEEKAIKYMISDNRLPELAIMDDDLLSGLLAEFDEPLDIPGIDENLLDSLMIDGQENDKPEEEWEGMPEFSQEDLSPFKTLKVHFKNQADVDDFAELIKQKITEKTKYIWIPDVVRRNLKDKSWDDES